MRSTRIVVAAALAAGTVAAGCGSDEQPQAAAQDGAKPAPMEISLALASVNMLYAPYVVGRDHGVFEKNGIKLNLVLTKDAATTMTAVSTGGTAIGAITTDALALGHTQNEDVAVMMEVVKGTPYSLVVNKKFSSPDDLRGQPLAASGLKTADGGIIRTMLDHYGMEAEKDYQLLVAGDPASRTESLLKGRSAGLATPQPQKALLEARGFRSLIDATDVPGLASRPFVMLATTRKWAAEHADAAERFMRAWMESVAIMYDPANKADVIKSLSTELKTEEPIMTAAYEDWIANNKVYAESCDVPDADVQNSIDASFELNDAKGEPPAPSDLLLGGDFCSKASS
jgi:ABC-type nitrate/sulfonate/bicarbonate transport system substrate-binding protein